jgi:putative ABC transport system permease protein
MRTSQLLKRNLTYYWRTNLAVVLGVAMAVAVLAGALIVGDSVRASLRDLFLLRLGNTDHVVTAPTFFREQLSEDLNAAASVQNGFSLSCPLIELPGSVSHEETKTRAGDVRVYGVDQRFWKFHGRDVQAPQNREVLISDALARELNAKPGDALLVQIEKPSEVPIESLYGDKEDLSQTLRLIIRETLTANQLGEFSTRPQQTAVRAMFVPLQLLQRDLVQDGRINTVLLSGTKDSGGLSGIERTAAIEKTVREKVDLEDYNIKLRALDQASWISLERTSTLIDDTLAQTATETAQTMGARAIPVFSYVANSITSGKRSIPYSLVTAIDDATFAELNVAPGIQSTSPPIVLNEWAARDLGVRPGDKISLEYYIWLDNGGLETRTAEFQTAGIVPISGLAGDRDLVPDYPGISESPSLSDWDPPFPVDLNRIRKQDEDYWASYRTTPKAFIPLSVGQRLWQSRFGKLTSLRIIPTAPSDPAQTTAILRQKLRSALQPAAMGLSVFPARQEGLAASRGATDFGEYFLYFSFFLVISALMLAALFFKLGVEQRLREIGLLQAVGFSAAKIRNLFLSEGILLAIAGSLLGLIGAVGYGQLMMFGLRTWWVDAVGTTGLTLHVSPLSLLIGGLGGVAAAIICIVWTLRRFRRVSSRNLLAGGTIWETDATIEKSKGLFALFRLGNSARLTIAVMLSVIGIGLLLAAAFRLISQVAGFFGGGTTLLIALLCYQSVWLRRDRRKPIDGHVWPVLRLGIRNAMYRPGRSVLCIALIASATFIIVSVDAFRRSDKDVVLDRKSGSGGFPLMAESVVPIVHDLNSAQGREALNLTANDLLTGASFVRFRLRPGDDASCLNLYQPRNPRVLGVTKDFIESNRFVFQNSLTSSNDEKNNPWLLLNGSSVPDVIPVIADANSITYVLHLKLGDELVLNTERGPARLRIAGALADSVFQSELLMSEENFLKLFPKEEGFRYFLIDTSQPAAAAPFLEDRLTNLGFDVVSTEERLANFHRVENTYLSTFQMLGGLGLLLGTLGMAAVLLRNVLERRRELALLRAVGYNSSHLSLMVIAENAFLLCCGVATGVVCALLAIAPVFFERGGRLPNISLGVLLLAVLVSGFIASLVATWSALRSPLLPALRAE